MKKIVIIGAGPAGMMAAITAAKAGSQVTVLEKKQEPGRKLKITGKGRCNITSALDTEHFLSGYPGGGKFLYSAINEFSNQDLIRFFTERGVPCKVERGNRVFPCSDRAEDVVNALKKELDKQMVKIICNYRAEVLVIEDNRIKGVKSDDKMLSADAVIIAAGGMSYPGTGSTGDGYKLAAQAGHQIITPRAGLVPLETEEAWVKELKGLSLKNVQLTSFKENGSKINQDFGEMLFTHFGLSGPIVLSLSRDIGEYLYKNPGKTVKAAIDLKPALTEEVLENRIDRDFVKYSRKQFKNSLNDLLPQNLIPVIIELSGIDPHKETNSITRQERKKLVEMIKNLTVTVKGTRPIAEAIVTAGGVKLKEVNPKSMESKIIKGLFFAGEVLDIDGYTGGFNLQAAFSTGFVSGKYASEITW
ncbi:MAG: NAD(P)/FAD-dependent oxidoreductase [Syntrophomonadaceae bacterium]|nr:NAD(P)/FAD-dependent oxidoreductase [Syntrophomonadaceae bacterium]